MMVHLICQNDSTECVVVGTKGYAMKVMADLKEKSAQKIRKNYGPILSKEYIDMEFWHVHTDVPMVVEGKFPTDEKWSKIMKIVDNQINNEALWASPIFKVKPIAEAQLQEALHKLHTAIEE